MARRSTPEFCECAELQIATFFKLTQQNRQPIVQVAAVFDVGLRAASPKTIHGMLPLEISEVSLDQVKCFIECFIVLNYASFFVYYMLLFVRFLVTFLFVGDHVRTYDFNFHLRFLLRVISNL